MMMVYKRNIHSIYYYAYQAVMFKELSAYYLVSAQCTLCYALSASYCLLAILLTATVADAVCCSATVIH
jgi:hypothetical protein